MFTCRVNDQVPKNDVLVVMGDWNVRVGQGPTKEKMSFGTMFVGSVNWER